MGDMGLCAISVKKLVNKGYMGSMLCVINVWDIWDCMGYMRNE